MTLRGFVQYVARCHAGDRNCERSYAGVQSTLAPVSEEQTYLYFPKAWPGAWPAAGRYYEFGASYGGPDYGPRGLVVRSLREAQPAPAVDPKPTYADGSWSIGDLLRMGERLRRGMQVSVTATVVGGEFTAPCPPGAMCAPQIGFVLFGDAAGDKKGTLILGGPPSELWVSKVEGRDIIGKRWRLSGQVGEVSPIERTLARKKGFEPALALSYLWHSPAKK